MGTFKKLSKRVPSIEQKVAIELCNWMLMYFSGATIRTVSN